MLAAQVVDESKPHCCGPVGRLSCLLDADSLVMLYEYDGSGVRVARGSVDGDKVVAFCTEPGAMTGTGCRHIVEAIDIAAQEGRPVVGLWDSAGVRLAGGVAALNGVGSVLAAVVRASGRVPQISVVLGTMAGCVAYGAALSDLVIMSDLGRMFVTVPEAACTVTGELVTPHGLGGPDVHDRRSGVAHVVTDSEDDALLRARRIASLLARPMSAACPVNGGSDLRALLPETAHRAYDVRPLVRAMLDPAEHGGGFEELQARWAPNMVVGLGRLAGRTIGVLANNPLRKGGCLDSLSTDKAARFVRMCDALGIPLLVVVDVPGYLPGLREEWDGVVRRGAKLLHAFAESIVPRVTLITRKSYGGAYIAMNSRALGANAVFAWPEAEIAVMGAQAAVGILHRKRLAAVTGEQDRAALLARLITEHEIAAGGVANAIGLGVVDEVIEPAQTRQKLAEAFAAASVRRGEHSNIPL